MCASLCSSMCDVRECLSFQSSVSMELSCLGQTSGSQGREPWVNFKLLPPSRRERLGQQISRRSTILLFLSHSLGFFIILFEAYIMLADLWFVDLLKIPFI